MFLSGRGMMRGSFGNGPSGRGMMRGSRGGPGKKIILITLKGSLING